MTTSENQLNTLDPQVTEFLNSIIRGSLTVELAEKYKLSNNLIPSIVDLIFNVASSQVSFSKIPQESSKLFSLDDATALSFSLDLIGQNFLFLASYFPEMMPVFESLGGQPEKYSEVIGRISQALAEERKYFAKQLEPEKEYVFQEKVVEEIFGREEYIEIFHQGVLQFLFKISDASTAEDFNRDLLLFLVDHLSVKNELFKGLMNNQELLGEQRIILENKNVDQTIANWLKDFIKEKGSDLFDELILVEYLTSSRNPKSLSSDGKDLLRRVLKLYRNIAFFPESQGNLDPEKWQILPFTDNDERLDSSAKNFTTRHENSLRQELELSLKTFPVGSLEHRAASEELARLDKNIN